MVFRELNFLIFKDYYGDQCYSSATTGYYRLLGLVWRQSDISSSVIILRVTFFPRCDRDSMVWKALSVRDSILCFIFSSLIVSILAFEEYQGYLAFLLLVDLKAGRFDWRIVLKQARLHCSPLAHRTWANTRAASCKPARIMLKFLINQKTHWVQ